MLIQRRTFLQTSALATASLLVPKFLKAFEAPHGVPAGNKVLVVLQLTGGNDGLNTVVPVRNDLYYKARPTLALAREKTLTLQDDVGLHPALTSFADAWHDGSLGILNSVGYPEPDRSHFRSMDIWQSASDSNEYRNSGWIGRYLDAQCRDCAEPSHALEIDDTLSLALKGTQINGMAMRNPKLLFGLTNEKFFRDASGQHISHHHEQADYLYKTMAATISGADRIAEKAGTGGKAPGYPNTPMGKAFSTVSSLIKADLDTKVYYVSHSGYDTHINQELFQQRALKEVNDAVGAFIKDLKAAHRYDDVLLVTFSEFGRRVVQNASKGTDHGCANNMFFFGGGLKKHGLLNPMADLTDLDQGDLKHKVDFRQVYATLLKNWLGTNPGDVLGGRFEPLNFI
ncbi:MAG: DUF1501 domain-containing protein [Chitinophagaceae bacterium]|nr:MAG: DUF1501 domain-containing protein [Chitinophagaceae bacterium]